MERGDQIGEKKFGVGIVEKKKKKNISRKTFRRTFSLSREREKRKRKEERKKENGRNKDKGRGGGQRRGEIKGGGYLPVAAFA